MSIEGTRPDIRSDEWHIVMDSDSAEPQYEDGVVQGDAQAETPEFKSEA